MIILNGKYNDCKVFTDNVDNETISQVISLLNQPMSKNEVIRIMPDTHAGVGCVIGTTMTISDKIIPNLVGVDIGCGMLAVKLKEKEIDLEKLDKIIREYIPSGFDINEKEVPADFLDEIKAPFNENRALRSIGTLGGGNHFIEVDKDSSDNLWLVIHTGSRHLGVEVCKYYQELGFHKLQDKRDEIYDIVKKLKDAGRAKEIQQAIEDFKKNSQCPPKELAYVEGQDLQDYLDDMRIVQHYAQVNRQAIAEKIRLLMGVYEVDRIETIHNYIDIDKMILRKGAISAQMGEKMIIPMNMMDGSLICRGKGNMDCNCSAPHGAGRIMSRAQAREELKMDDYREAMKDIFTTSVSCYTIDEAPMAYKPMQEIVDNIKDTVDIIDIIKPIYNFKAN